MICIFKGKKAGLGIVDIRITNTKNRIQQGLLKCMAEKPFREIYSRDVIAKAEISSRTFYHYYSNKNEVLDDTEDELIQGLKKAMEADRKDIRKLDHLATNEEIIERFETAFRETVDYWILNRTTFLTLLSENGDIGFLKKIYDATEKEFLIRTRITYGSDKKIKENKNFFFKVAIKNYVSSIICTISYLLQYGDKLSPLEMRKIVGKIHVNSPVKLIQDKFK